MSNIIKNTMTIFTRHKEYIGTIVKGPILITLIYTFIFAYQAQVNIAMMNDGTKEFGTYIENALVNTDLIKIVDVEEKEIESKIQNGKIEFAILIDEDNEIEIVRTEESSVGEYMEAVLAGAAAKFEDGEELIGESVALKSGKQLVLEQNDVGKKGLPVANSLGIILFKMIAASSLLAELLIMERKNGIAQRVAISKTSTTTYLAGRGFVFFLNILLFIVCYFATTFLFKFDFGMRAPLRMAVIFIAMGVFTTAFGLLLAALLKNEGAVWNVGVLVVLPSSVLSGALLPFEAMPELMQKIGSIFPQRWIASAVEILQDGGTLLDTAKPLGMVLGASLVMFAVSSVMLRRKRK